MDECRSSRISDYSAFLSTVSRARRDSTLRKQFDLISKDCIFLSNGIPNPKTFPITETTLTIRDDTKLCLKGDRMEAALQYGRTEGDEEFIKWLTELQRRLHRPPTMDNNELPSSFDVIINTGRTGGISMVMDTTLNKGDNILTEEYTFPFVFDVIKHIGARAVSISSDSQGMDPANLENILSKWNENEDGRRPKILYGVMSASNPTGVTWSLARKREIYKIAQKYNLLIVEDDPYYMLQFSKTRVPSFLSLDVDGRVVRIDSFSVLLPSGIRLGYISGPKQFIHKIVHSMLSVLSASYLSQAVIFSLLQHLGYGGFINHLEEIRDAYQSRANKISQLLETHLQGLAEWTKPSGGMFLWIKLLRIKDSSKIVDKMSKEHNKVFVAGRCFTFNKSLSNYLRLSYSVASDEQMDKALAVLAEEVKAEQEN